MDRKKILEIAYMCLAADNEPHDHTPLCERYQARLDTLTQAEIVQVLAEVKRLLGEPPPVLFGARRVPLR